MSFIEKFKKVTQNKIVFVISIFILVFIGISFFKVFLRQQKANQDISRLIEQIKELELRNRELLDLIEYFKTDDFIEFEARTKLNLQKEGEKVVIIPETSNNVNKSDDQKAIKQPNNYQEQDSNLRRWWNYFFGKEPYSSL